MELVYTVTKPHRGWRRDCWLFRDETPMISLSPKNAIAFCTTVDLDDEDEEDSNQTNRSLVEMVHHVYVCDIDKPWSLCRLISVPEKVVGLEWHQTGSKLLVATVLGTCYVWQMKDFLLNSWVDPPWMANISGEEIVAVSWLHLGNKMTFMPEKRENQNYAEKHFNANFTPSLSHFGGKAVDGLLAVTATGMAVVTLPKMGSSDMKIHMEMLCPSRRRIRVADIAFSSKGDILVATSDGSVTSAILCYKISLQLDGDNCSILCTPMTSFYARCHLLSALRESPTAHITHVKYMHQESGDVLIVSAGDTNVSHVELWNLTASPVAVHRIYVNNLMPDKATGFLQEKWILKSSITHTSLPTSIAVPRFPVSYGATLPTDASSLLFQYIAIAYKDGSVKLVNKHTFQAMTTTNLDTGIIDLENPDKKRKSVAYMTHMQQSFTGCILVGVDQYSCMYVMKVVNTRDPVTQVPAIFIVCMLEYVLLTGLDWWDVLTAVKPGVIETIVQKLCDNFSKQMGFLQDQLICRLLAMKAALYRCGTSGQFRAADCHSRLVLHSISSHFRSMLRPKILSANEVSPSEKLIATCNKSIDTDIDAVLMTLNSEKKFVVDSPTLQSMQQLMQWVADLTTYILASLPLLLHGQHTAFPGATLLHDVRVLGTLRELLVVVRMWGLINSSCLPNFTTTTNMSDCLPQLFKLLTKVWLAVDAGRDFDEALADECSALASQIMLPAPDEGLFGNIDYSSSVFAQSYPLKYTFGEMPSHAASSSRGQSGFVLPQGVLHSKCRKDVVRQIVLGVHTAEPTRMCVRCGCISLMRSFAKVPAMKAWELRFERYCVCGGQWKIDQPGKRFPVSS